MIYLLTLQIGGATIRIASEAVTVPSAGGDLVFQPGLIEAEHIDAWSLAGTPVTRLPVRISSGIVDVPAMIAQGHDIASAEGELAIHAATWETRRVIVAGRLSEPEYDEPGYPFSFSLRVLPRPARVLQPPPAARVSGAYWRGPIPSAAQGLVVPIVFGEPSPELFVVKPGAGSTAVAVEAPSETQPPAVSAPVYICADRVAANTVQVCHAADDVQDRVWTDGLAVSTGEYGFSKFSLPAALQGTTRARFLVRWNDGGGALRPISTTEPVRTVGELIEYLLWRLPDCDRHRTSAAVRYLPHLVDGYIDSRVDVIDWIRDNIASILPVQIVAGPEGIYPVVARPLVDPSAPVRELSTERREITPAGPVVLDGGDTVYNEIEVQYNRDAGSRQYLSTILHTGDPDAEVGEDVTTSRAARLSRSKQQERAKKITTNIVQRSITAYQIAEWMIRRYALPSWVTSYTIKGLPDWMEAGAGVRIADHLREVFKLCLIEEVAQVEGDLYRFRVRTVELP